MNIFKKIYFKIYLILKYGIHWHKKKYIIKLARNLIRAKCYNLLRLFGINKFILRGIDFAVTYACNFKCTHCYAERLKPTGPVQRMSIADYERVAKEAMDLGIAVFSFQGGEPALEKNLINIIKVFRSHENHITITTNGSLVTEEMIRSWAEAGVDTVYFSIDSGIPEEHDAFRNYPGSFQKIMKGIEWVKKYKMKVAINTTISRDNLYTEGLKKIFDYSHKNRIMLETIFARPLGNWTGYTNLMLSREDIKKYYELRRNYPFVVRDLDNNYGKWGCPAVKEVLYITTYGDVCGCPYNHISLGNVMKEPLKKIVTRGLRSKWYNHYHYECLTAVDENFIHNYYLPLTDRKGLATIYEVDNQVK